MGNHSTKHHLQAVGGGPKPKKFVHWKSAERPLPPGRPTLIPLSDQQPDVITLKWNRPPSDGGSPIIGFLVEHRRTGSPHWVRATPGLVPRPEISISGLEPGWRYQFRVIAENVVGKSDPSELSDPLTVTLQRNAISVPRFVDELKDTTAVENERVELRVSFIGHPAPEINWFKDGFEIFSSRRTKIVNENDCSTLIIHQAAFTDEGEIKCTATNRAGHVVTRARLSIEAPPKIRLPRQYEDGLIFEAEEVVRLKVGVAGQPMPAVVWCHEGEAIRSGGRFESETTEKNSSLKIANIKREDRGEYSVKAVNKLGEDIASFLVTVTSKPNPPGKVKLQMSFGRSATLTWETPSDDGGCKIGNYIVEYFRIGWNVWLKAATTRKQTVTLHDLIEGSEYKFRVKAENPYGLSDPSDESDILFVPDPTRGIMKPQQVLGLMVNEKPIPPKRRNLSPLRNILGKKKETSPSKKSSPGRNPGHISEMYDSEDIKREMSYGTSNDMFLEKDPKRIQLNKKMEHQLEVKVLPRRSPSPSSKKLEENRTTLKPESINQRVQNFFRLSPRSARKSTVTEETQTSPRVSPASSGTPQLHSSPDKTVPNLPSQRPGTAHVRFEDDTLSPITPRLNTAQPKNPTSSYTEPKNNSGLMSEKSPEFPSHQRPSIESSSPLKPLRQENLASRDQRHSLDLSDFSEYPGNIELRQPRLSLPSPRIEISQPSGDFDTPATPKQRSNVHTSSEFMLVLYPNKKSPEQSKQDSFELDLEESLAHPQLSLSAPDLGSDMLHLQELKLRRSVSSTELLYERAMARFYEAVELEEAEKTKRLQMSEERSVTQNNLTVRKRLGSMTEAERLSFERRSQMRRKLSEDFAPPLNTSGSIMSKWDSKERLNLSGRQIKAKKIELVNNSSLETQESEEVLSNDHDADESSASEYGDDYTDSTASSDSIEKFKIELMARTQPINPDLETYHPGNVIESESFSPYRSPDPDQSSIVLLKPVPLPNPDFVPKPILKRPSIDNNIKESDEISSDQHENSLSPQNANTPSPLGTHSPSPQDTHSSSPQGTKSPSPQMEEPKNAKPASKSRSFKSFFKRDKASSDSNVAKNNKLSPRELSPRDSSSKESSPRQPQNLSEKSPPPRPLSPKDLSPKGSLSSPKSFSPTGHLSPAQLSPKQMSPQLTPKELSPSTGDRKPTIQERKEAFMLKQGEINQRIDKQREEVLRKKLESSKSAEEETRVVVDYYSHIVNEMGHTRKDKKPLYLTGGDLAKDEEEHPEDMVPSESSLLKHRLSIVERLQTAHVQEKSKHALDQAKGIMGASQDDVKPAQDSPAGVDEDNLPSRGRSTTVPKKVKKRGTSGSRSRDTSVLKIAEGAPSVEAAPQPRRIASRSRTRNPSKSPGAIKRRPIKRDPTPDIRLPLYVPPTQVESRPQTPEEMSEEAQEKIRSTVSYVTDVGLFVVACWVYLFKDARLVIPILALMVYRQISELIRERVPRWLPSKKS